MAGSTGARARRPWRRSPGVVLGVIFGMLAFGTGGVGAVDSTPSTFSAVNPVRVFDTRTGLGGVPAAPIGPGATIDVVIGGTNGIPADAKGVSLNVTVVNGTAASYLTVWPGGDTRPEASHLNWTGPEATPNAVTVGLGTSGKVSFYNSAGVVNVLADVVGYYTVLPPAILNQGGSAQAAQMFVDGQIRTTGLVRTGNGTGTADSADSGLVTRRTRSRFSTNGNVVARATDSTLTRDGTTAGLVWTPVANGLVHTLTCNGIRADQTVFGVYRSGSALAPQPVVVDAPNWVMLECEFGTVFNSGQPETFVRLQREATDNFIGGLLISSVNQ